MNIAEKLKTIRTENKLTQKELAEKLNIAMSIIGDIETGRRVPSKKTANKLAHFFNTTLDYWIDENAEIEYVKNRNYLFTTETVIKKLFETKNINNGIPTEKGWGLIKEAILIDLKFLELKK